jgi:ribonuclease Y
MEYLPLMVIVAVTALLFLGLGWRLRSREDAEPKDALKKKRPYEAPAITAAQPDPSELIKEDLALSERELDLEERERKLRERTSALDEQEKRLKKEKSDLNAQTAALEARRAEVEGERESIAAARARYEEALGKAASLAPDEAKQELLRSLRSHFEGAAEKAAAEARRLALARTDRDARRILSTTVSRLALDAARDLMLHEVILPHESYKGKIIGKEGRNIRAFESETRVKLIIDDAPRRIILSAFDPEQREAARQVLLKMIEMNRFHPESIAEFAAEVSAGFEASVEEAGHEAFLEAVLDEKAEVHSDLLRLMGRLKFLNVHGQNLLHHSIEVAHLAGIMADEMELDGRAARRAGFFHDVGYALTHEKPGTHAEVGAKEAARLGESAMVVNAIAAHHEDAPAESFVAGLVAAANVISTSRAGVRTRMAADPIRRMEEVERLAKEFPDVEEAYAVHIDHEVRVIVDPDSIDEPKAEALSAAIAQRIEKEIDYSGKIVVTVVRETRAEATG